jgi:D-alanyl-D-alanine carboxypeptidase
LLDTTFRLQAGYAPPDLASAGVAGFAEGYMVRRFVLEDLGALREAAEAAGNPVDLIATYRSHEQQADLFQRRVDELGETEALARTARPGHSEHQLGTAVDFRTPGDTDVTQAWASTPQARWLEANAHRFGFIESYPDGEKGVTCYGYEPWHYRYFGVELAADIHASGLTSREYLWFWQQTGSRP